MCASLKKSSFDHRNINNYRPISNLPFLGKGLEKVVASRLRSYLTANVCILSITQHRNSCYSVINDILLSVDSRFINILILFDLSSAFDCLWGYSPQVPFWNCQYWFRSFLTHLLPQQQKAFYYYARVQICLCSSLPHGVPQGSVFGPFFFIINMHTIGDIIHIHISLYLIFTVNWPPALTCHLFLIALLHVLGISNTEISWTE